MNKSRRTRWPGDVARMRALRNTCKILTGKPESKGTHGRPKHNRKVILKHILRKQDGGVKTGLI
jgi:hypothetical protein